MLNVHFDGLCRPLTVSSSKLSAVFFIIPVSQVRVEQSLTTKTDSVTLYKLSAIVQFFTIVISNIISTKASLSTTLQRFAHCSHLFAIDIKAHTCEKKTVYAMRRTESFHP
jgi:hypothetical protein